MHRPELHSHQTDHWIHLLVHNCDLKSWLPVVLIVSNLWNNIVTPKAWDRGVCLQHANSKGTDLKHFRNYFQNMRSIFETFSFWSTSNICVNQRFSSIPTVLHCIILFHSPVGQLGMWHQQPSSSMTLTVFGSLWPDVTFFLQPKSQYGYCLPLLPGPESSCFLLSNFPHKGEFLGSLCILLAFLQACLASWNMGGRRQARGGEIKALEWCFSKSLSLSPLRWFYGL